MKYIIYLTENTKSKINGLNRIYIGVHGTEDPAIFDGYIGCGVKINQPSSYMYPKTPFQYAVKRFGVQSFKRTTLYIFDTAQEAYLKEHEIVTQEFINQAHVYNVALGGEYEERFKPLYQYSKEGVLIKKWELSKEAYEFYGFPGEKFDSAKRNKILFLDSFWTTSETFNLNDFSIATPTKITYLYSKEGKLLKEFNSLTECSKYLKQNTGNICAAIKRNSLIAGKYYVSYKLIDIFIPKKRLTYTNKTYYVYNKNGEFVSKCYGKELMKIINLHSWNKVSAIFECGHNWYKDFYISFEEITEVPLKRYLKGFAIDIYTKYGEFIETLLTMKEVKEKYKVPASKIKNIQFGDKYFGDYIFKYNSK